MKNLLIFLLFTTIACTNQPPQYRIYINLEGDWQFALDTLGVGEMEQWYLSDLGDQATLPGTTDSNKKGFLNQDTSTMHLNRVYKYEGRAWYRKKIHIPESMSDKHLLLSLERTKTTKIWVDDTFIGGSGLLQTPQQFDVSKYLSPGEHYITIMVNNDLKLTPYGNVHIYTDETQTNWNGIIGKIYIEALSKTFISGLQVYPDIYHDKIKAELKLDGIKDQDVVNVELLVKKKKDGETIRLLPQREDFNYHDKIQIEYDLGDEAEPWDEYNQPLYELTAIISANGFIDAKTVPFGMRKFTTEGTQFTINDRTTFLRGKHDASVFPMTGHPPMDVEGWRNVFQIAKLYGINHYRFHSYCPPDAAFTAADMEGLYLSAELPFWGGLDSDTISERMKNEGLAMLDAYANHPSFVMFSHGNEIWSGHDRVEKNLMAFKEHDSRPLYTMGCNNSIGFVGPGEHTDFFVGARTPSIGDTTLTHTRLTHAFADSREGAMLNMLSPSTEIHFDYPVSQIDLPIISHEIGQYQIFPDYEEISKYTGMVRAWNLEVFKNRLEKAGMLDQDSIFQQASGAWSALCYKAEMEAAIRTKGFGGFQLLDLQDFSGQGTALVGILDAFMDSKNVISPEVWKQSCNDVVLLLEFTKYCWTNNEKFASKFVVANYSNQSLSGVLKWALKRADGTEVKTGSFDNINIPYGGLTDLGDINIDLSSIQKAEKLLLSVFIPETDYSNEYPIWVYPENGETQTPHDITVTNKLNSTLIADLQKGGKMLYFPETEDVKDHSVPGLFPPDFWNFEMFKQISENNGKPVSPGTLGLLMDPDHPLFNDFPTDFHTNWQWFSIIKASNSFFLDDTKAAYRPIIQVIDNLQRNHKLGLVFEFKVGEGKLLICMSQLNQIMEQPEAKQLYQSIFKYMDSEHFNPRYDVEPGWLLNKFLR